MLKQNKTFLGMFKPKKLVFIVIFSCSAAGVTADNLESLMNLNNFKQL
jgi:hypothetical protein